VTHVRAPDPAAIVDALRDVYDPCCADRGVMSMSDAIPDRLRRMDGVDTVDVRVVWDPVWTMDRLSESAREKLVLPLDELAPIRERRIAQERGA
jgi:metal-sulfur cluster biosynthetic enzyme